MPARDASAEFANPTIAHTIIHFDPGSPLFPIQPIAAMVRKTRRPATTPACWLPRGADNCHDNGKSIRRPRLPATGGIVQAPCCAAPACLRIPPGRGRQRRQDCGTAIVPRRHVRPNINCPYPRSAISKPAIIVTVSASTRNTLCRPNTPSIRQAQASAINPPNSAPSTIAWRCSVSWNASASGFEDWAKRRPPIPAHRRRSSSCQSELSGEGWGAWRDETTLIAQHRRLRSGCSFSHHPNCSHKPPVEFWPSETPGGSPARHCHCSKQQM